MLSTKRWFKFDVIEHKGPLISSLVQNHGGRFAGTVACLGFDADDNWWRTCVSCLQGRRKLKAMRGYHAVVVVGGGDHGSGIASAALGVVHRRVAQKVFEHFNPLTQLIKYS